MITEKPLSSAKNCQVWYPIFENSNIKESLIEVANMSLSRLN